MAKINVRTVRLVQCKAEATISAVELASRIVAVLNTCPTGKVMRFGVAEDGWLTAQYEGRKPFEDERLCTFITGIEAAVRATLPPVTSKERPADFDLRELDKLERELQGGVILVPIAPNVTRLISQLRRLLTEKLEAQRQAAIAADSQQKAREAQ